MRTKWITTKGDDGGVEKEGGEEGDREGERRSRGGGGWHAHLVAAGEAGGEE